MPIGKSYSKSSKSSVPRPRARAGADHPLRSLIEIGKVLRAHGLGGAVVVGIDASVRDVLRAGVQAQLRLRDRSSTATIASAAPAKGGLRVTFEEVGDRTAAEALVGAALLVEHAAFPTLDADEYYDFEVLGWRVVTPEGKELGEITEVIATGASDVYVVTGEDGEILVPVVRGAVLELDRTHGCVLVEPSALEYSRSSRSDR